MKRQLMVLCVLAGMLVACDSLDLNANVRPNNSNTGNTNSVPNADEVGQVVDVIDGDTIDVEINGQVLRVRYIGVNTPERDETCYREAVDANEILVSGQTVSLVRDQSETDRYGRLLRYVYVGNTFVNESLVIQGYAEAVLYGDDDRHWSSFVDLEGQSARASRGCHPTGIFNDGSNTR